MGQIPLLLRGKQKVQVEIDLYSTCNNFKRLINLESMDTLLLKIKKSGRFTYLYAVKGYRDDRGVSTSKVVREFGTLEELKESLNGEDPIEWAQARVAEMTASEKDDRADRWVSSWIWTACRSPSTSTRETHRSSSRCVLLKKNLMTTSISPGWSSARMPASRHTRTGKDGTKKWNCYSTFSSTFITICCFSLSKSTRTLSPSFMPVRMMSSAISSSIYFWMARLSGRAPNCTS